MVPLRSLRWVEAMLSSLDGEGCTEEQVLFAYRTFNSFLLAYLLLETSAMALRDPKPGDGSFASGPTEPGSDAADSSEPMPGGLSPARTPAHRHAIEKADSPKDFVDPTAKIDPHKFATVHRLAAGLAQDRWQEEFDTGLTELLDRIEEFIATHP